ncbi:hypothetical protein IIB49_00760 [Patescibacteria group bacterium]|nr:hypothetical protein [Patescibacteria group bacterium]
MCCSVILFIYCIIITLLFCQAFSKA